MQVEVLSRNGGEPGAVARDPSKTKDPSSAIFANDQGILGRNVIAALMPRPITLEKRAAMSTTTPVGCVLVVNRCRNTVPSPKDANQ